MNLEGISELARDAAAVRNALDRVTCYVRGVVIGANTQRQSETAERMLTTVEGAQQVMNVVATQLASWADEAATDELEGGDGR